MKKLRYISLLLDESYSAKSSYNFNFDTGPLTTFIARNLPLVNNECKYSQINIYLSKNPINEIFSVHKMSPYICDIHINYFDEFENLSKIDFYESLIINIINGIEVAAEKFTIPKKEIIKILDDFRSLKYKNNGILIEKEWKSVDVKVVVDYEVTRKAYTLAEKIYVKGIKRIDSIVVKRVPTQRQISQYPGKLTLKKKIITFHNGKDEIASYNILKDEFICDKSHISNIEALTKDRSENVETPEMRKKIIQGILKGNIIYKK